MVEEFLESQEFILKPNGDMDTYVLELSEDEGGASFVAILDKEEKIVILGAKTEKKKDLQFISYDCPFEVFKNSFLSFIYQSL